MELFKVYPYNLAFDVALDEKEALQMSPESIDLALSHLADNQIGVLKLRYQHGMTLREIGEIQHLTSERIRQIQSKALHELRKPNLRALMKSYTLNELTQTSRELDLMKIENKRLYQIIDMYIENGASIFTVKELSKRVDVRNLTIDQLDISVRLHNSLYRGGIRTLGDLDKMLLLDIKRLRGIGPGTFKEVVALLDKYGISKDEL